MRMWAAPRAAVLILNRGVGLTADQRSPKPRVGVRIPPPLPNAARNPGVGSHGRIMADEKNWIQRTKDYVNDLKLEMRRVTWPNRKQVEGTTAVVIVSVFAFAGYFAIVDGILSRAVGRVLVFFSK